MAQHGWDAAQIAWRRQQMRRLPNPMAFRTEYPEDPLSGWLKEGRTVFHLPYVLDAFGGMPPAQADAAPGWREFVPPKADETYWIGVDPAEGVAGGDFSAIEVFDATGEQCAEWVGYVPIHQLAELIKTLRYPPARIVVERNNHGHALLEHLVTSGLPLFYDRDRRPGLLSTRQAKAQWISRATHGFWQHRFRLHSYRLYQQLTQYVYDAEGHAGGPAHGGDRVLAHDDLVSAFLLAVWELVDPHDRTPKPVELREVPIRRKQAPRPALAPAGSAYPGLPGASQAAGSSGAFYPLEIVPFLAAERRCGLCGQPLPLGSGRLTQILPWTTLWQESRCPACGQAH
jgi:hypothetical protein